MDESRLSAAGFQAYLRQLALEVVALQRQLNRDFERQLQKAGPLVQAARETGVLQPADLLPKPLRATAFKTGLELLLRRKREASGGVSLGLLPLTAGFRARYAQSSNRGSCLCLQIEAVPVVEEVALPGPENSGGGEIP